jgi:hypothetical protein
MIKRDGGAEVESTLAVEEVHIKREPERLQYDPAALSIQASEEYAGDTLLTSTWTGTSSWTCALDHRTVWSSHVSRRGMSLIGTNRNVPRTRRS